MPRAPKATKPADSTAHLGFEAKLWLDADKLRKHSPRSVDLLGRVYEHYLTRFTIAEGMNGGQFYTPCCVVRCLVGMLATSACTEYAFSHGRRSGVKASSGWSNFLDGKREREQIPYVP